MNAVVSFVDVQIRKQAGTGEYKYNRVGNWRTLLFRYERFINFLLLFFDTRRITQFLQCWPYYLTLPTFGTSRNVQDLCQQGSEKSNYIFNGPYPILNSMAENSILCLHGRNSVICLHGPISTFNWLFFKILKFSGPSTPGMMSSLL